MSQNRAVYAGTFDPLTNGHQWMIERGTRLFDELVVAIGVNPDKQCLFSIDDRLAMLREATAHWSNVRIDAFTNQYLIAYSQTVGANYILRGIRSAPDYEFERTMRNMNGDLGPQVTTVFLMPPRELAEVSSSMVKSLVGPQGWQRVVEPLVPSGVFRRLLEAQS